LTCVIGKQVSPFNIKTLDGEQLFAWHVLPLALYAKHEEELLQESEKASGVFTDSIAFKLLVEDPNSRLIINR
jgi:abhydrolase domain-containing protein 12